MNTYELVIGDWSGDGHGKTKTEYVELNLTTQQITQAMARAVEDLNLGSTYYDRHYKGRAWLPICDSYGENKLTETQAKKLFDAGLLKDWYKSSDNLDNIYVDIETFTEIWARMVVYGAKLNGIKDAKYKLTDNHTPSFGIGGYGLFS